MSELVNIHQAKTHLSKFLEKVARGEEIVIAKAGEPVAKLVPYVGLAAPRMPGALAGQVAEADGCWEADDDALDSNDQRGRSCWQNRSPQRCWIFPWSGSRCRGWSRRKASAFTS